MNYTVGSSRSDLGDDQWHHYAFVRRGSTLEIWIDGVLDNSKTMPGITAFNSAQSMTIMARTNYTSKVDGALEELAFYNHALTPADIRQRVIQSQQPNQASIEREDDTLIAQADLIWVHDARGVEPEYGAFWYGVDGSLTPAPKATGPYVGYATLDLTGLSLLRVASGERGSLLYRRIPDVTRTGLVKVASGGFTETWTYGFDANSNITSLAKPAGTENYGYDARSRLDDYTLPGNGQMVYGYDEVGNRLSQTQSGVAINHTYGTNSNRQLAQAGQAIGYDANGNQISDQGGNRTFTYNGRNRLSQVIDNTVTVGSYSYNALGQRVRKVAQTADVDFVYDLNGQLLGEYANGSTIREYVQANGVPMAKIEAGGDVHYLHADHLGTPRAATDDQRTVVWQWEGEPFGETAALEDPDGDLIDVTVNLRFPGQYFDMETERHYNYFRDYDPSTGRYVQSDPIGLAGGMHRQNYVGNSPLVWVDSLGLNRWNEFQRQNPGYTPSENSGRFAQYKLDQATARKRGRGTLVDQGVKGLNDFCTHYHIGAKLSQFRSELEFKLNTTSSCQTVYWQLDAKQTISGMRGLVPCTVDVVWRIGTDTSVWRSHMQPVRSFFYWHTVEQRSARGRG